MEKGEIRGDLVQGNSGVWLSTMEPYFSGGFRCNPSSPSTWCEVGWMNIYRPWYIVQTKIYNLACDCETNAMHSSLQVYFILFFGAFVDCFSSFPILNNKWWCRWWLSLHPNDCYSNVFFRMQQRRQRILQRRQMCQTIVCLLNWSVNLNINICQ